MMRAAHYPDSPQGAPASAPRQWLWVGVLLLLTLAAGCAERAVRIPTRSSVPPRHWANRPPADPASANAVLMRAISLVGTPYRYGGNTPEGGFDCSGLIDFVFRDMLDVHLPRSSRELASWQGPRVDERELEAADLVFFGTAGDVSHVGIYVGEGRFVHAPRTGGTVRLDRLDGLYWRDHYSGAKRILGAK